MRKLLVVSLFAGAAAMAQDRDWVRAWEAAQGSRPASIAAVARIAPESEPGTPLVIRGRVLKEAGRSPAAGVIVFAYHTDRTGVYSRSASAHEWRLRGWAKTDADGRFEFRTIRPGMYPGGGAPAHVHFTIEGPGLPRRWGNELQFDEGRRVATRNGVQYVDFEILVSERGRF